MSFLPIVERELRVAARRRGTYRVRFFGALGILLVWLILAEVFGRNPVTPLSQTLFLAFGVLALAFCLLAGVFLTADCLSEEKRAGTLGLLFLTDLRGYDVVLGKLIATSLHAVYGLLAIFPILGLPLLMGGVTVGEFWRMQLSLLATLLLSLSLGMFISTLTWEARDAIAATLLGMLLLAGVLPALHWLQVALSRRALWDGWLLLSPVNTFIAALDSHYRTRPGPHSFWASLVWIVLLGLGFLVAAAILLPGIWNRSSESSVLGISDGAAALKLKRPGKQAQTNLVTAQTRRLASKACPSLASTPNPYLWLGARRTSSQEWGRILVWVLLGVWSSFLLISLALPVGTFPVAFVAALFSSYALHQTVKGLAAVEATRQLNEDRSNGALELMLVSPLTESEIISGHQAVFSRNSARGKALLVLINVCVAFAVLAWGQNLKMRAEDQGIFFELFAGGILMVFLDFHAMSLVSAWMALRSRRHHRAVLGTLGRVLAPPWAALFLMIFFMQTNRGGGGPGKAAAIFACWFSVGIVTDLVITIRARQALRKGIKTYL